MLELPRFRCHIWLKPSANTMLVCWTICSDCWIKSAGSFAVGSKVIIEVVIAEANGTANVAVSSLAAQ